MLNEKVYSDTAMIGQMYILLDEERSPKVASGRKHETESDNIHICLIIAVSEI